MDRAYEGNETRQLVEIRDSFTRQPPATTRSSALRHPAGDTATTERNTSVAPKRQTRSTFLIVHPLAAGFLSHGRSPYLCDYHAGTE